MANKKIALINYGSGNYASVANALARLKIPYINAEKPDDLKKVSHIILPGVGSFAAAMRKIYQLGFNTEIMNQVETCRKPFLGICVGMQILASIGTEHESHPGLDLVPGIVRIIDTKSHNMPLPHIGWNDIEICRNDDLFDGIYQPSSFYFVHSYAFIPDSRSCVLASCDYGQSIAAVVKRDNIYGVQFHPEKSQKNGLQLLNNFFQLIS